MQHVQRLTKRRIALVQMEQSLNLLAAGDPVSALTLAGAAEEILGRIAARKGKEPRVGYLADYAGSLYKWAGKPPPIKEGVNPTGESHAEPFEASKRRSECVCEGGLHL